jgi:hypothetical protein
MLQDVNIIVRSKVVIPVVCGAIRIMRVQIARALIVLQAAATTQLRLQLILKAQFLLTTAGIATPVPGVAATFAP